MTKRVGGFLVPDDMELALQEQLEEDTLEEEQKEEGSSEATVEEAPEDDPHSHEGEEDQEEVSEETSEETTEEVSEEVTEEVSEEAEEETPQKEEKSKPVAVLTVYGKEIPIYTMDELIAYAQRGFDYSNKLYQLKQWRSTIEAVNYNPQLKMLVEKVIQGEDISKYIVDPEKQVEHKETEEEAVPSNYDFDDMAPSDLLKTFEQITDKKIKEALAPFIAKLKEQELANYLKSLEERNPKYHKTVTQLILMALQDPNVPAPIKEAIRTDRNFFENMYFQIKEKVEELDRQKQQSVSVTGEVNKPKEEPAKKKVLVEKKRSVSKIPKLEGSRDSQDISTEQRLLDEAEKIWSLSPEEFRRLEEKAKKS